MKYCKKVIALFLACCLCACSAQSVPTSTSEAASASPTSASQSVDVADPEQKAYIEETLNLANNPDQEWTYNADAQAWILSIVSAVAFPELPDQQGVSVCVPAAYVLGIDTDGDGQEDVTSTSDTQTAKGSLVIDAAAQVTSSHGQVYTAAAAPVILNTGAAGYGSSKHTLAATTYASEGYINVSCGNRGKQDTAADEDGNSYYTGDAPSCLVDQKNAARFVKYNILLGNLPGSVDYFVSTGGSGGGAHAVMFAATSNHSDFYDYEIAAGAVGVYLLEDGGHVPSEIFSESFTLYVGQMYGEYVSSQTIEAPAAQVQTTNGTDEQPNGTDISSWVNTLDLDAVSFTLADAAAYRTKGASKAIPGFDVIDYGQEDYVFGSTEQDARHWNSILLDIFQTHADVLAPLFNAG